MEVSSGEYDESKPDASTYKEKAPAGTNADDEGASLVEQIAPNLISSNTPERTDPSIVDRVATIIPPAGGHGHKRPPPVIRRKQPLPSTDQVMT
jgi:hypothetical protein